MHSNIYLLASFMLIFIVKNKKFKFKRIFFIAVKIKYPWDYESHFPPYHKICRNLFQKYEYGIFNFVIFDAFLKK